MIKHQFLCDRCSNPFYSGDDDRNEKRLYVWLDQFHNGIDYDNQHQPIDLCEDCMKVAEGFAQKIQIKLLKETSFEKWTWRPTGLKGIVAFWDKFGRGEEGKKLIKQLKLKSRQPTY